MPHLKMEQYNFLKQNDYSIATHVIANEYEINIY